MEKTEVNELKKLFDLEKCGISQVVGCYVNGEKKKVANINEFFKVLPEEEQHKYFDIFRKSLSGQLGRNLIDMEFTKEAYDNQRDFLIRLRDSALKDEKLLDEFYDKIIESYEYIGNYLILLINQDYDVPTISTDNIENEDASEEVYRFILCAICPVELSKPGLEYIEEQNTFHNGERSYMVGLPETSFLFPAFTDRSEDRDRILLYTKDTKEFFDNFINCVLNCQIPLPANKQKDVFQDILTETLENECNYELIKNIHEEVNAVIETKKEDPEVSETLTKKEIKNILENSGVNQPKLERFEESFDTHFNEVEKEAATINVKNIFPAKKVEIKTADVLIKVDADKMDAIQTQMIDGKRCLVIRVDEELVVDGIPVVGI